MDTPATKNRMHDIGVTGVALERRSPEYLAKFVVDEIARWAGPIEANGLQVVDRATAPHAMHGRARSHDTNGQSVTATGHPIFATGDL